MLRPCPSVEEVFEDASEEENALPVQPKVGQAPISSLKQGLELFTDDQLQRLMGVVAKDMRFKYDLFLKLRLFYSAIRWVLASLRWPSLSLRHSCMPGVSDMLREDLALHDKEQQKLVESLQTIADDDHVLNGHCFTCGQPGAPAPANGWLRFSIRRLPATLIDCCSANCNHRICSNCANIFIAKKALCVYCSEKKKLDYKKKEWNILLWPLTQQCFGWSKFKHVSEGSTFAAANWTMRAKIELHLIHLLDGTGVSLDSAQVDFQVSDMILESSRHKLVMALMDYSTSGHFAHIDYAIAEVRQVLRRRSNCIHPCSTLNNGQPPSLSYFHLLSNAIISMLLHSFSQHISCTTNNSSLKFRRPRRVLLPCLSEQDNSCSTAITARGLLSPRPVHSNHKHFPVASLQASRPSFSSHLEDVKESPDEQPRLFFQLPELGKCVIPANEDSLPPTPGPLSSPAVLSLENGSQSTTNGHITIAMEQPAVEASAGQLITIRCAIQYAESEPEVGCKTATLQIIWYNRRRQIPNTSKTGRVRVSTNKTNSVLEIFDCNAYKDSGDIVCVALGDCVQGGVQAATTRLIVHDDDIAGEEPMFVQPLFISNSSPTSSYSLHCKTIAEGDALLLKCRISGLPQPYLKFFVSVGNKQMIDVDSSHKISYIDDLWTLQVDSLKLNGSPMNNLPSTLTYTVVAMNRIGKCSSSIQLTLVGKSQITAEQQTTL